MKIFRAIGFGIIMWAGIFVILSILMFIPFLQDKDLLQFLIYWILLIPLTLFTAKWYFKQDSPSLKKGILIGLVALFVMCVLDVIITVPLFVKSYTVFYGNPYLYVGFAEFLILTAFAGYEFDATYTK